MWFVIKQDHPIYLRYSTFGATLGTWLGIAYVVFHGLN